MADSLRSDLDAYVARLADGIYEGDKSFELGAVRSMLLELIRKYEPDYFETRKRVAS